MLQLLRSLLSGTTRRVTRPVIPCYRCGRVNTIPFPEGDDVLPCPRCATSLHPIVLVCDLSAAADVPGARYDRMEDYRDCANWLAQKLPQVRIVGFNSEVHAYPDGSAFPSPRGEASLVPVFRFVARFGPVHTILCLGCYPGDMTAAVRACDELPGLLDVVYSGEETSQEVRATLTVLAQIRGGVCIDDEGARWHRGGNSLRTVFMDLCSPTRILRQA